MFLEKKYETSTGIVAILICDLSRWWIAFKDNAVVLSYYRGLEITFRVEGPGH